MFGRLKRYILKAFTQPPQVVARKIVRMMRRSVFVIYGRYKAYRTSTFCEDSAYISFWALLDVSFLDLSGLDRVALGNISQRYLEHRFDLLGSGWVRYCHGDPCLSSSGMCFLDGKNYQPDENGVWITSLLRPAHTRYAVKVWRMIANSQYIPIDWQRDIKSGYRFCERAHFSLQFKELPLGVDIKVPWELGRMQHLVQLALAALVRAEEDEMSVSSECYVEQFRCQALDFIATNPPQMGVQWACPMDVAIRAANLLVAHDLFCQVDSTGLLTAGFEEIFIRSILDHGQYLVHNLEWVENGTSNHYLANICGLIFIGAYLDDSPEADLWLAFGIQELLKEFPGQFYSDGGNFESSTSYHRLSLEMVAYAVSVVLGLPQKRIHRLAVVQGVIPTGPGLLPSTSTLFAQCENLVDLFDEKFRTLMARAGNLTRLLRKPDGTVPQLGDNDSGRFFRLSPNGHLMQTPQAIQQYANLAGYANAVSAYEALDESYFDEDILNHDTLIATVSGLVDFGAASFVNTFLLEPSVITGFAQGQSFGKVDCGFSRKSWERPETHYRLPYQKEYVYNSDFVDIPLNRNGCFTSFPDSGLYVYRSDRVHMVVCGMPNGQRGHGGHNHNDKLSFDLTIDGKVVWRDPGTYIYTPFPDVRNLYRSVQAHNAPQLGAEQNRWFDGVEGLFSLQDDATVTFIESSNSHLTLELRFALYHCRRTFRVEIDRVCVVDEANVAIGDFQEPLSFSPGYGKLHTQD